MNGFLFLFSDNYVPIRYMLAPENLVQKALLVGFLAGRGVGYIKFSHLLWRQNKGAPKPIWMPGPQEQRDERKKKLPLISLEIFRKN